MNFLTQREAYRRTVALSELEQLIKQVLPEVERTAESAAVPKDLRARIAEELAENPSMAWDEALDCLSRPRQT